MPRYLFRQVTIKENSLSTLSVICFAHWLIFFVLMTIPQLCDQLMIINVAVKLIFMLLRWNRRRGECSRERRYSEFRLNNLSKVT